MTGSLVLKISNWEEKEGSQLLTAVEGFLKNGSISGDKDLHLALVKTLHQYIKQNDYYKTHSETFDRFTFNKWWCRCCHDMKLSQKKLAIVCAALETLNMYSGDEYAAEIFQHIQSALIAVRTVVLDSRGDVKAVISSGTLEKMLKKLSRQHPSFEGVNYLEKNPYEGVFTSSVHPLKR